MEEENKFERIEEEEAEETNSWPNSRLNIEGIILGLSRNEI